MASCSECQYGHITWHSQEDKCLHVNNTGYHPYALRHDEKLCGAAATWFAPKPAPTGVFVAVKV
jgi:hypothetical protein